VAFPVSTTFSERICAKGGKKGKRGGGGGAACQFVSISHTSFLLRGRVGA